MYVAITRARDRLVITYPVGVYERATGLILSRPSRFVEDVPAALLEPWALSDDRGPVERGGSGRAAGSSPGRGSGGGPKALSEPLPEADADGGIDAYFRQDSGW